MPPPMQKIADSTGFYVQSGAPNLHGEFRSNGPVLVSQGHRPGPETAFGLNSLFYPGFLDCT